MYYNNKRYICHYDNNYSIYLHFSKKINKLSFASPACYNNTRDICYQHYTHAHTHTCMHSHIHKHTHTHRGNDHIYLVNNDIQLGMTVSGWFSNDQNSVYTVTITTMSFGNFICNHSNYFIVK